MFTPNNSLSFFLNNFELIFDFSPQNQLIALALLIITAIINLYAISQNRKFESLIGSLYCLSSIACIFAGDFISMIISLEFMTIFSCIIIFCQQLKLKPACQYFLTHLFSSGLMLIGISLLISSTGSTIFIPLTKAVYNFELPAILILLGCLINIGAVFVNGWMVNCYPIASNSGIIYLISFTTKIMLIIILKLFSGLEILKFFGISMIIYGLIFAFIEKNLKRIVCYLTLSQLGFVLAAISANLPNITFLITSFIFTHILYNGLFILYFSILEDQCNIKNYQDLKNAQTNIILLSGFIITILIYISVLPISSSYIKEELANMLDENYIMIFLKIATSTILFGLLLEVLLASLQTSIAGIARHCERLKALLHGSKKALSIIPWLVHGIQKINKNTNKFSILSWIPRSSRGMTMEKSSHATKPQLKEAWQSRKITKGYFLARLLRQNLQFFLAMTSVHLIYLSFCIITLFICIFYPIQISPLANSKIIIITISVSLALLLRKLPRISTENFNLDLYRYIEKFIYFSIDKYKEAKKNEKEEEEYFTFKVIWNSILNKISAWHNQQTSIFIIVLLLLSLILLLHLA